MIPDLDFTMYVREAYADADDVPTIALSGAVPNLGPVAVLLKGSGLDLEGVTIGQAALVRVRERIATPEGASSAGRPGTR